jgi:hypothetical protein
VPVGMGHVFSVYQKILQLQKIFGEKKRLRWFFV